MRHVYWLILAAFMAVVLTAGSGAGRSVVGGCSNVRAADHGARTSAERSAMAAAAKVARRCDATRYADSRPVYGPDKVGVPSAGYHHTGHQSVSKAGQGVQATIEVSNPLLQKNICHPGCAAEQTMFVAARVLSKGSNVAPSYPWIESGWVEHNSLTWDGTLAGNGNSARCPYAYSGQDGNPSTVAGTDQWFTFCNALPLTTGSTYLFRTYQLGAPGVQDVTAEIFYGGVWQTLLHLTGVMACETAAGGNGCYQEVMYEPYIGSLFGTDAHPDIGGGAYDGAGSTFQALKLQRLDNTWTAWSTANAAVMSEPSHFYEYCGFTKWTIFRARQEVACANP